MRNRVLDFIARFFKRGTKLSIFFKYRLKKFKKNQIFFFHINRSGGNSLKIAFDMISNEKISSPILRIPHKIKAKDINFNDTNKYIFSLRDPIDRFYSVFYIRKIRVDGSLHSAEALRTEKKAIELEKKLFSLHKDINSLCENLYNKNQRIDGLLNIDCVDKISSLNDRLETWFNIDFLNNNKPFFIFEFENLQDDFDKFCKKINYEKRINLGSLYKKHKSGINYDNLVKLSEVSRKNLLKYLENDYKIYNYLIANKDKINNSY